MVELKEVYRGLADRESFFVTLASDHLPQQIEGRKTYFVPKSERNPLLFLVNCFIDLWILLKERPKVIISTGASFVIPAFAYAKLLGIRTVYIETFARIHKPSLTGRIIYRLHPDRFFVQWEEQLHWFPRAIYQGALV
jgi:UDP-N-acetylglucosamine:LPS N-acetylglucosamine transferase